VTIDESIPARSKWGLAARDVFLEQFSEINFYVEDENQENFYLEVFTRLFPKIHISQIFGLGGKANVLEHSSDPANAARQVRSIYVLDKDFDDLLGKIQRRDNVFYLDKYCIENYLFDEDALVAIAIECHPKKTREQHLGELAFAAFLSRATSSLEPLFRLFFAVQKLELGIRNCDRKPEEFSNKHKVWTVSSAAVARYREDVLTCALELNKVRNEADLQMLLDNCFPIHGPADRNISGKFILGLLFHYLRHKLQIGNISKDSLRYRLARNGSLADLRSLRSRINRRLRLRAMPN
jgi:Protein of unknown function (DUF4435)